MLTINFLNQNFLAYNGVKISQLPVEEPYISQLTKVS